MATQFEIDNALMAGRAYFDTRASVNRFPVPNGWTEFFHVPNSTFSVTGENGFEATSFRRGSEIVIAFAGTDFTDISGDWTEANFPLAFGDLGTQLVDAARYYLEVKAANPTATISFTGHSLGGGLASLMAVFFDEQAVTFDQAPFAAAANDTVRAELEFWLNGYGYSDATLTSLVPEFMNYSEGTRTGNVTGYYVQGDVLQNPLLSAFDVIGVQTMLAQHSVDLGILGSIDLHSQTLLTAFLLNDGFRDLTFELPNLLQAMFDEGLYERNTATRNRNFLDNLIRHQIGVAADPIAGVAAIPADAMLDRFVVDLAKLTPDTYGTASGTDMAEALTVYAMEYHYLKTTGAMQAFTLADYGLHFKYSDIGATSYKSLPKLVDAVNAFLTPEEKTLLNGRLVKQDAWHIQSGTGGMIVHAGADNDIAFGGTNSDGLWGGGGIDILIGGANNDVLVGEAGNDYLLGGIGNDTYIFSTGDGFDTVLDSDGSGVINLNGIAAQGSATAGLAPADWIKRGNNNYADTHNGISYTVSAVGDETRLYLSQGDTTVLVKGWSDGELGIHLGAGGTPVAPPTVLTGTALNNYLAADSGGQRVEGLTGRDMILGVADTDRLLGGDDNDWMVGNGGADQIEGGTGNDYIVEFGAGSQISGGDGNDTLYGLTNLPVKAPLQATLPTVSHPLPLPSGSHCAASRSSRRAPPRRYTSGAILTRTPAFPVTSPAPRVARAARGRFVSPVQGVCPRPHWKRTQLIDRQPINSKMA